MAFEVKFNEEDNAFKATVGEGDNSFNASFGKYVENGTGAAVLYTPQDLNEAQQQQARENIGITADDSEVIQALADLDMITAVGSDDHVLTDENNNILEW